GRLGRTVTLYAGFDPSAPSLHVGHLMQLCTLRRFQLAGHRPISLAGGATGMVGDPGGKSAERQLLGPDELAANVAGIRPQLEHFLQFGSEAGQVGALLLDNSSWLGAEPLLDFLRDVGKHFTVNQMVAKESVRARLERPDQGISYTEFSYMLLQAYDFLRLHADHGCDLQIGGSDQWGNITMGVELIHKVTGAEVYGMTTPLVLKADGTKFGKTESGTVWLDPARTSPYRFLQFFVNCEDATVGQYLRYFTYLSHADIEELDRLTAEQPERRAAQHALAREVCTLVHGADATARAERAAAALFTDEIAALEESTLLEVVDGAPAATLPRGRLGSSTVLDAIVEGGLVASRGAGRRAAAQGGIYVNNRREEDAERPLSEADLLHGRYVLIRRGRRDQLLLTFE
ncbi:MAG TPA: tyrosine--tRNA ligase, partial [Acidimicrobiales bacterium]|nr:tyrosine--tRNA ligase [Acidimicrobiales bacterium]